MSVFKFMNLSVQQVVNEVSSLNTIVFPIESDAGNEQSLASTEAELFINCNTWKNPFQLQLAKMLIKLGYRLLLVRVKYNDNRTNIRIVNKDLFSYFDPNKTYEYNGNLEKVTNIRDITETLGTLTKRLYYNNCILSSRYETDEETQVVTKYWMLETDPEPETQEVLDPYILIKSAFKFLVIFTPNPKLIDPDLNGGDKSFVDKYPPRDRLVVVDIKKFKDEVDLKGFMDDIALQISTLTGYSYTIDDEKILLESYEPTAIDVKSNIKNLKIEYNQNDDYDEFTSKLVNEPAMILMSKLPDSLEDIEVEIINVNKEQINIKLSRVDSSGRSLYAENFICDRDKESIYSVESMLSTSNLVMYLDAGLNFFTTDISGKYTLKYTKEVKATLDDYISVMNKDTFKADEDIADLVYVVDSMTYYSITEFWKVGNYDKLNRPFGREVSEYERELFADDPDYLEFLDECEKNYKLYGEPILNEEVEYAPQSIIDDRETYRELIKECSLDYADYLDKVFKYHQTLSEIAEKLEAIAFVSDPPYYIRNYTELKNLIYFTPNMTYGPYTIPTYYVMLSLLADSRYNGDVTTTMDLRIPLIKENQRIKCVTEFMDYQYLINDGWSLIQIDNDALDYRSMYYILATLVVKKYVINYIDEHFIGNYSEVDFTDLFDKLQDRFNKIILSATLEELYTSTNTLNATILITYREKNKYIYKFNINLTLN